jgi:hypothetical protein
MRMSFAAVVRPVIDRLHVSVRFAARPALREAYAEAGLARPGFETNLYYGLLARPISAQALADALVYQGVDGSFELESGLARHEAGVWHLTERGRTMAEAHCPRGPSGWRSKRRRTVSMHRCTRCSTHERLELLGGLGALADGLSRS